MPTKSLKIDNAWKKAILIAVGCLCILAAWSFSKWGMASSAAVRAEDPEVAKFSTELAPDDPQTHYAAGVLLERSFEQSDIEKALNELEVAAGLAPENYLFWLELGRARERSGDPLKAELALRRALELAPNYSRVQWALGNTLLRQGRVDDAFGEIQKAVAGDPVGFAGPAAITAWQFFDKDLVAIRRFGGGSIQFDSALAALLIREKRLDQALELWRHIPAEERKTSVRQTGVMLIDALLGEKQFRLAVEVSASLADDPEPKPEQITNGGFESAVKPAGSGPFEWTIAPGLQPQIVLSNGQKHSGSNSLLLVFSSNDGKEFRTVSQLIPVQPNTPYELEIFYRADVKTNASFKWEVVDAGDGKQIALSPAISNSADWSPLNLRFTSGIADGIILRLIRDNCVAICPVNGSVGFDDISLRRPR